MNRTPDYFAPLREECQRYAVAAAYEVPFESTPPVAGLTPTEAAHAWTAWATEHDMRWWRSGVVAPVGLKRWLAVMHLPQGPHEVAMTHSELFRDDTGNVQWASLEKVKSADWLWPADRDFLASGTKLAPINAGPGGAELVARPVSEPGHVNQTVLVYPADRPPTPLAKPNRAARRAVQKRKRR